MTNGVLVTWLVGQGLYQWSDSDIGLLLGIPVITGSLIRLPLGLLADRYGGRGLMVLLLLVSSVPMYLLGKCDSYGSFLLASLGFGMTGGAFAVGIAYTSVWFSKKRQGLALGIFGAGNAGAAITSLCAPMMLDRLTDHGSNPDGWRDFPAFYAAALVVVALLFFIGTTPRRPVGSEGLTMRQRLDPLKDIRVWRFGFYYFLVFGAFVGLAQWLIPYYVNVYGMSVATAGAMAAIFSFPSGVIRILGGAVSDRWGARLTMYAVLLVCLIGCFLLIVPRMDIESPGRGVMARVPGVVESVSPTAITVSGRTYVVMPRPENWDGEARREGVLILPSSVMWQEALVLPGDTVIKNQLLARGTTHVYFQANVWIFTVLVFIVGIAMGIGKAAVYKYIPEYFPNNVGAVGGLVGVIGGLGGAACPIIFGWLLGLSGIWTTCWMFLAAISLACLVWLYVVVRRMVRAETIAARVASDVPRP